MTDALHVLPRRPGTPARPVPLARPAAATRPGAADLVTQRPGVLAGDPVCGRAAAASDPSVVQRRTACHGNDRAAARAHYPHR
jgi:hypothetical protein